MLWIKTNQYSILEQTWPIAYTDFLQGFFIFYRSCLLHIFYYFQGYYRNLKATEDAFAEDRWLKTGDMFFRDENWNFFFVERIKLLLKYRSYHVSLYPINFWNSTIIINIDVWQTKRAWQHLC